MPAPIHEAQDGSQNPDDASIQRSNRTDGSKKVSGCGPTRGEGGVERGEGGGEPLFCGQVPEKVYGMEDYTVTETG